MRSNLAQFNLVSQLSLSEILSKLNAEPKRWKLMAGGTDLMVLLNAGKLSHREFLDIWHLKELRFIETSSASHVVMGALSTYSDIASHPVLKTEFPNLPHAALETGAVAIQNRGTIGGNIINASPAADTVPALLAYGAEKELISVNGSRWVKIEDFYSGYKKMDLHSNEMLARVRMPRLAGGIHFYRKVGTRRAQAISKVCIAGFAKVHQGAFETLRIALGGLTPAITLAYKTQDYLLNTPISKWNENDIRAAISLDIAPIDDVRSNAKYRATVAQNVILQFVAQLRD